MKKLVTLVLSVLLLVSLTACGGGGKKLKEDHTMYLITDKGTIDDKSFNQGSYDGLKKYAEELGVKPNYLRPNDVTTTDYVKSIDEAVKAGAKVIVTPGFLFDEAVFIAQEKYPDVKFVFVDAEPSNRDEKNPISKVADNTVSILYREEQSGFLAGYAAVKEGMTNLGFMGGVAVPAVVNFGYGFVAGANYAAQEDGVDVKIRHTYLGDFLAKPEFKTKAESWFNDGVEVIFAAAGGAGASVMQAAADTNKKVIGVDVDQRDSSPTVITSATKNLEGSVYDAVKAAMTEEGKNFPGGKTLRLGVDDNGVKLPDEFDRFTKFNKEQYDAIYKVLQDNKDGITDKIPSLASHGDKASALIGQFDKVTLSAE